MLHQFAHNMTNLLLSKQIVKEEDREIYQYGMEALASTLVNIVIVFIIGILTNLFTETIIYLSSFALLRVFSGGYHSKTHLGCVATFLAIYLGSMALISFVPLVLKGPLSLIAGTISLIAILILAPVEHPNRPLTVVEFKTFKRTARWVASIEWILIFGFALLIPSLIPAAFILSLSILSVVLILVLAQLVKGRGESML